MATSRTDGFVDGAAAAQMMKLFAGAGSADYIVASGVSGGCRYIKWNSGCCLCAGKTTGTTSSSGKVAVGINYPFTIYDAWAVCSGGVQGDSGSHTNWTDVSTTGASTYVSGTASKDCWAFFVVVGRWK